MADSSSPSLISTGNGISVAGLVALFASLGATFSGHGGNLPDSLGALSGVLGAVLPHFTNMLHKNKALDHDAQLAVAAVPDIGKIRQDLDAVGDSVHTLVGQVDPHLANDLVTFQRKTESDLAGLAQTIEAKAGVSPTEAEAIAKKVLANMFAGLPAATPEA